MPFLKRWEFKHGLSKRRRVCRTLARRLPVKNQGCGAVCVERYVNIFDLKLFNVGVFLNSKGREFHSVVVAGMNEL